MLLMIDNYDSFTYNLVQYFAELGETVEVHRNDRISVAEIAARRPARLLRWGYLAKGLPGPVWFLNEKINSCLVRHSAGNNFFHH